MIRRIFLPALAASAYAAPAGYRIQLDTIRKGYDGKTCWVHPRAGAIPGKTPSIVLTMSPLDVSGSDIFEAIADMRTDDLGRKWTEPAQHRSTLERRAEPGGVTSVICDFYPKWHAKTRKLLGVGHTARYRDGKVMAERRRETAYSIYDPAARAWSPWVTMAMPAGPKFENAGAGSVQRVDAADGSILLPVYFKEPASKAYSVTVLRCRFDGRALAYETHGNELRLASERGFVEPSLARFDGRYFLSLRNDSDGYAASSPDGLRFDEPRPLRFDDGSSLGNYNTQTHWVTHANALFLVYTRKGANNDHVFRHRAPLFIAHFDPAKMAVIRRTERIAVPERGARLGNFGVVNVNERETWITTAEWMQTWGPNFVMPRDNKYGSDNSVYAARLIWDTPNRGWDSY